MIVAVLVVSEKYIFKCVNKQHFICAEKCSSVKMYFSEYFFHALKEYVSGYKISCALDLHACVSWILSFVCNMSGVEKGMA